MSERMEETAPCNNEKLLKRKYKEDVDEQTVVEPKEVKKPPMPTYGKYNILKVLKENHCLIADEEQLTSVFPRNKRFDLEDVKSKKNSDILFTEQKSNLIPPSHTEFINKTARKSQSITQKNNKSIEFKRATGLIKSIEARRPLTDQTLDIPLSLKTITDVFNYEEEVDVDVRMLYQTLTNLSLGFPTSTMDNATSEFLYGVYQASSVLVLCSWYN